MDENKTKKLIQDEITKYMNEKQFALSKIPIHRHNGVDTVKINENDLIPTDNFGAGLVFNLNETIQVKNIPNFNVLTFYGIAYDGAYDPSGGTTYTKKASIVGEARVGKTYSMTVNTSNEIVVDSLVKPLTFYQVCTSTYIDEASLANASVSAASGYFAYVYNGSTVVASVKIKEISGSGLTLESTVSGNWTIQGFLIVS